MRTEDIRVVLAAILSVPGSDANELELIEAFPHVGLHYQRAGAVTKMARYLREHHSGTPPNSLEALLQIPGLGDYSARAILSFGYGVPAAIVYGNVARVLGRVFRAVIQERNSKPGCD